MKEIIERNERGQVIYRRGSDGFEVWCDYDNVNLTHYCDSNGYEVWREYDAAGNLTHYSDSNGYEVWQEYDAAGNLTHYHDSNGLNHGMMPPELDASQQIKSTN